MPDRGGESDPDAGPERYLLTDPDVGLEQYFLTEPQALARLVEAAGVLPDDHVVEVGAGIGTVAAALPPSRRLTLVELDPRLARVLAVRFPHAQVICGDAVDFLSRGRGAEIDVLLSNLPAAVNEVVVELLPRLPFRTAVLALGQAAVVPPIPSSASEDVGTAAAAGLFWEDRGLLAGTDFRPVQPAPSRLVRVRRRG